MSDFNSFNKFKGLLHRDHFEGIAAGKFLPPYCVCTDPSNSCMQDCIYCNSKKYREASAPSECYMDDLHLLRLADFYKDWGVQSTIIEGGGEPLLNPHLGAFIDKCYLYDIEMGIITNGVMLDKYIDRIIDKGVRFVGISFDAATPETYKVMRGENQFDKVLRSIVHINRKKSTLDVNMKMLIHEHNYKEIYDFTLLAKESGCNGVHIKPVSFENLPIKKYDLAEHFDEITAGIEQAKTLEDDNFKVYAVMYKFGDHLEHKVKFDKCNSTPIGGVFGADGNFWLCFNMRGSPGYKLGTHYPDPYNIKYLWGGKHHKTLINNINVNNCMRCGLTAYNEIMENCINQDKLFWKFL
jgi:MoaA/NifB/PqqE/SkfB family radical SAM enzyme